jgi:hypothetical protein
MRHFLLLGAMALGSRRVLESTTAARLITLSGRALLAAPRLAGAAFSTVDVAAVAAGTDEHEGLAARTQKQARGCMSLLDIVTQTWTKRAASGILPRHSCPARVWGSAPMQTSRLGSAPSLSSTKTRA